MKFDLLTVDGAARRGRLVFARGTVETPTFMPVGTHLRHGQGPDAGADRRIRRRDYSRQYIPSYAPARRRGHPRTRRPASFHALGRADPHRLRRFPGLEPRRVKKDHREGRHLPVAGGRRAHFPRPGAVHGRAAGARCRHYYGVRRMHPAPGDRTRGARVDGALAALGRAQQSGAREHTSARDRRLCGLCRAGCTSTCATFRSPA